MRYRRKRYTSRRGYRRGRSVRRSYGRPRGRSRSMRRGRITRPTGRQRIGYRL